MLREAQDGGRGMKAIGLAAAGLFAAMLLAEAPAAAQAQQKPLPERLRDACRALREVDRARLPAPRDMSGLTYHADTRAGAGAPPAGHSGPLIRLFQQQSVPGPFPSLSVIAWKRPDGRWFVSRLRHDPPGGMSGMPLPWPHEPGVDAAGLPASYWSLGEGVLAAEESAELERILASRCLSREPPVRPGNLPVRRGPERTCMWHPTSYHLEISGGGAPARGYTRSCRLYAATGGTQEVHWASDLLVDLLVRAPLGTPAPAARREAEAIPERFRGRWAQGVESCDDTAFTRVEVGARSLELGSASTNRVRSVELRGERTLIVHATGSGFFPDLPSQDFTLPLLLSPDGERMAVPQAESGWLLRLNRCPAA
jgi:hypothetical protein